MSSPGWSCYRRVRSGILRTGWRPADGVPAGATLEGRVWGSVATCGLQLGLVLTEPSGWFSRSASPTLSSLVPEGAHIQIAV